jgi:homoserine dehydrogenase
MRKINLIHLGIGNVGKALVRMILENRKELKEHFGADLNYCGLFNSKSGIFDRRGFSIKQLKQFPADSRVEAKLAVDEVPLPFILIDTTASDKTFPLLEKALQKGGYVVLSNKRPLAGSNEQFKKLHSFGNRLFYETTVGAGLPVIRTLKTLLATGDDVSEIYGCFSGTLGFICSSIEDGVSFSESVRQARKMGYTEFDPREDLSGADVGRKTLILARMMGMDVEPDDIKIQKLYPTSYDGYTVEQFMQNIDKLDKEYQDKIRKAKKRENTLRFIAKISQNICKVRLTKVAQNSNFGSLKGPDNMIIFKTKRYSDRPMVIKGPGAGSEVTAAGVLGDILTIVRVV